MAQRQDSKSKCEFFPAFSSKLSLLLSSPHPSSLQPPPHELLFFLLYHSVLYSLILSAFQLLCDAVVFMTRWVLVLWSFSLSRFPLRGSLTLFSLVGLIPVGWLKNHRSEWYKQHLGVLEAGKNSTFTAAEHVYREMML